MRTKELEMELISINRDLKRNSEKILEVIEKCNLKINELDKQIEKKN